MFGSLGHLGMGFPTEWHGFLILYMLDYFVVGLMTCICVEICLNEMLFGCLYALGHAETIVVILTFSTVSKQHSTMLVLCGQISLICNLKS